jgi:hypothetical protein
MQQSLAGAAPRPLLYMLPTTLFSQSHNDLVSDHKFKHIFKKRLKVPEGWGRWLVFKVAAKTRAASMFKALQQRGGGGGGNGRAAFRRVIVSWFLSKRSLWFGSIALVVSR